MKIIFYLFIFACTGGMVQAQAPAIVLATDKTVSLIFPFPVKHVDRGTKDVVVQRLPEDAKILLVKAGVRAFGPTNLTVLTEDGTMYSFPVSYAADPPYWIYRLPGGEVANVETYAKSIINNPKTMRGICNHSWDIWGSVTGIYIKDKTIFYQLSLDNKGPLDYDLDFLRLYIRDHKKTKRTAMQEMELQPLYVAGNLTHVKSNAKNTIVVALQKFTLADRKFLAIEVHEKNGGRHLLMKVNNKKIIKAKILPD